MAIGAKGGSRPAGSPDQSEQCVIWEAVITPRWQYVLAAATPKSFGDPVLVDETLSQVDPSSIHAGDAVGIGIHTANALPRLRDWQNGAEPGSVRNFRWNSRHTVS
jgi:hypothetical protein